MKIISLTFLGFFIVSCGTQNASDVAKAVDGTNKDDKDAYDDQDEDMLIVTSGTKPECKKDGQLIYVKDKKQFESCSEGEWVVAEVAVQKSETINNTYNNTSHWVYTGIDGKEYIYIRNVQKNQLSTICPADYHVASEEEFSFVAKSRLFGAINGPYNLTTIYFLSDKGDVIKFSTSNYINWSQTLLDEAHYPYFFTDGMAGAVCLK